VIVIGLSYRQKYSVSEAVSWLYHLDCTAYVFLNSPSGLYMCPSRDGISEDLHSTPVTPARCASAGIYVIFWAPPAVS